MIENLEFRIINMLNTITNVSIWLNVSINVSIEAPGDLRVEYVHTQ